MPVSKESGLYNDLCAQVFSAKRAQYYLPLVLAVKHVSLYLKILVRYAVALKCILN